MYIYALFLHKYTLTVIVVLLRLCERICIAQYVDQQSTDIRTLYATRSLLRVVHIHCHFAATYIYNQSSRKDIQMDVPAFH